MQPCRRDVQRSGFVQKPDTMKTGDTSPTCLSGPCGWPCACMGMSGHRTVSSSTLQWRSRIQTLGHVSLFTSSTTTLYASPHGKALAFALQLLLSSWHFEALCQFRPSRLPRSCTGMLPRSQALLTRATFTQYMLKDSCVPTMSRSAA